MVLTALPEERTKLFFERIRTIYLPIVLYHLCRGREVYAFDFTHDMKRRWWLRRLINSGRVRPIYVDTLSPAHGRAIDQTEIVFNSLRGGWMQKAVTGLFGTDEAELIFKNCDIYSRMTARCGAGDSRAPRKVRRSAWHRLILPVLRLADRVAYCVPRWCYLVANTLLLALGNLVPTNGGERKHFRYAIAIDQKFQIAMRGKRYFDFLIDNKGVTAANSIFLFSIPIPDKVRDHCRRNGYRFLEIRSMLRPRQVLKSACSRGWIWRYLAGLARISVFDRQPLPFLMSALQAMNALIEQKLLRASLSFDHYVYTNQEHPKQLAINILVRRHGTETWNYALAVGGGFIWAKGEEDFPSRRNIMWAYLNGDHYVLASRDAMEYNKLHCQNVAQYHDVGSVFSELVREYLADPGKEALARNYFGSELTGRERIISFFDTTFIDSVYCPTTYDDAICFYEDILRLLDEFADIYALFKPSKADHYFIAPDFQWSSPEKGRKIAKLREELKRHERVHWAGTSADVPAVIAASDLVVTHCLSSPTFEALGARKRAIWYESGDKHRGVLYDSIPDLIAHGYEELKERVQRLLWEVSEDEYAAYLGEHIKDRVESYLDGQALRRFRRLLAGITEAARP
jgi:polysaccharide biosynthesis PFTS motif protein